MALPEPLGMWFTIGGGQRWWFCGLTTQPVFHIAALSGSEGEG